MPSLYYAIYQSRDGALWLGSNDGLVCFRQGQWSRLGTELYRPEVRVHLPKRPTAPSGSG